MRRLGLLSIILAATVTLVWLGCTAARRQRDSAAAVKTEPGPSGAVTDSKHVAGLVAALGDPGNETRATAAASLRRLLAADPDARTNDHGRDYWEERAARVKPGMKHAEAVKLFPPLDQDLLLERLLWSGPGSGQTHIGRWRLDHYWVVIIQYRNPDTVLERPTLENRALHVWVKPPDGLTGTWVTWHVNGQKGRELEYANGKYYGAFIAYHDNGQKSYEQHYENGVCSGTDTGWYRNGRKSYAGRYANGKREGTWTHWYEDGRVRSREQSRGGQPHGIRASWYANGQKQYEVHYRDGRKHGPDKAWDERGKLLWSREYRDGELVRAGR